ncbi:thioredoxin family protein [Adhaeretor mobilis]|uniref:Thiol:disulfide interchange protein DsbD n=1 Tax=Adhaeretor mobilis TaxID=1930276 RepID=A0A517MV31_9BACT|nr:Thiol:disulfide interchange protein DsbD [Adhaeretor mobilis]
MTCDRKTLCFSLLSAAMGFIPGAIAAATPQARVPIQQNRAQSVATLRPSQPPPAKAPQIFNHASVDHAWKTALKRQRPLVIMFTSDQCHYCKKMLLQTYRHPGIQRLLIENSETVLAHAEKYPSLLKQMRIQSFPTTLVISPQGKVLEAIQGYVPPNEFADRVAPQIVPKLQTAQSPSKQQAARAQPRQTSAR